jgi:hypothetical protein
MTLAASEQVFHLWITDSAPVGKTICCVHSFSGRNETKILPEEKKSELFWIPFFDTLAETGFSYRARSCFTPDRQSYGVK